MGGDCVRLDLVEVAIVIMAVMAMVLFTVK